MGNSVSSSGEDPPQRLSNFQNPAVYAVTHHTPAGSYGQPQQPATHVVQPSAANCKHGTSAASYPRSASPWRGPRRRGSPRSGSLRRPPRRVLSDFMLAAGTLVQRRMQQQLSVDVHQLLLSCSCLYCYVKRLLPASPQLSCLLVVVVHTNRGKVGWCPRRII